MKKTIATFPALLLIAAASIATPALAGKIYKDGTPTIIYAHDFKGHRATKRNVVRKRVVTILPAKRIARKLKRQGYYNLRNMRTDGRVYTVKARGRRGNLVRLTVNGTNGRVIHRKILRKMRPVNYPYNHRYTLHNRKDRATLGFSMSFGQPLWNR